MSMNLQTAQYSQAGYSIPQSFGRRVTGKGEEELDSCFIRVFWSFQYMTQNKFISRR